MNTGMQINMKLSVIPLVALCNASSCCCVHDSLWNAAFDSMSFFSCFLVFGGLHCGFGGMLFSYEEPSKH